MSQAVISFPSSEENIRIVRKFAHEEQFSLHKEPNQDLWSLKDLQSDRYVLKGVSLWDIYD